MQVMIAYIYDKYSLESLPCLFFKNNYNSLSVLINSICCFLLFKSFHIKKGAKIIQFIAPLTFGIYLIHFNVGLVSWLYSDFLPIKEVAEHEGYSVLLSLLLFGFIVFTGSAILEMARQYTIVR